METIWLNLDTRLNEEYKILVLIFSGYNLIISILITVRLAQFQRIDTLTDLRVLRWLRSVLICSDRGLISDC